jgi:hypothetical protein
MRIARSRINDRKPIAQAAPRRSRPFKRVGGIVFWRIGKLGGSFYWAVRRSPIVKRRRHRPAVRPEPAGFSWDELYKQWQETQ